jgi:arylsulfatase A-like enzyme
MFPLRLEIVGKAGRSRGAVPLDESEQVHPFLSLARKLAVVAAVLTMAGCSPRAGPEKTARNLVVVVIDTLRQDRVGAYGYRRGITPTLDRLAREGARADGLAPSSWTRPSVATLFSGLHPLRHQVAIKTDRFPEAVRTLPMRLREVGFSTLGVSTNGHVSAAWGFDRGFDELAATWRIGLGLDTSSEDVNQAVFERLARLEPPFFLYVHYLDPHQPYAPKLGWDGAPLSPELARLVPLQGAAVSEVDGERSPERLRAASDLYDAEIREVDGALGDLLATLDRRGLGAETLTIVLSDHGEEFGEHGGVGHGETLYDEVVRVPLVLHAPSVIPPGTEIGRFPLESVLPTALDLLGRSTVPADPREFDGPSFASKLRGLGDEPELGPRVLYLEGSPKASLGLIDGSHKLLLQTFPYRRQLFDLRRDPGETRDVALASEEAPTMRRLSDELPRRYGDLLRGAFERSSTTADESLSRQLAALGYGGANQPQFTRRAFPRRLVPGDLRAGGPRGWEDLAGFRSCGDTTEDPAGQLLEGWWGRSESEPGQWTLPVASLAVARDSGMIDPVLEIEGINWRGACELTISTAEGDRRTNRLEPGPFRLQLPISKPSAKPYLLVRLELDTPFYPRLVGLDDPRELGIFVTRYCLRASAAS